MTKGPSVSTFVRKKSGKGYFITGTALLFVLAFVWSIDASLVYILLGVSTFLFFLGFRDYFASRPILKSFSKRVDESYRAQTSRAEAEPSAMDEFSELLKQARHRAHKAQASAASPSKADGKKVVAITMIFIAGIFLVIILSAILVQVTKPEMKERFSPRSKQIFRRLMNSTTVNNMIRPIAITEKRCAMIRNNRIPCGVMPARCICAVI